VQKFLRSGQHRQLGMRRVLWCIQSRRDFALQHMPGSSYKALIRIRRKTTLHQPLTTGQQPHLLFALNARQTLTRLAVNVSVALVTPHPGAAIELQRLFNYITADSVVSVDRLPKAAVYRQHGYALYGKPRYAADFQPPWTTQPRNCAQGGTAEVHGVRTVSTRSILYAQGHQPGQNTGNFAQYALLN